MKIICQPTKDTYITNKKLALGKDAKGSNVGYAGTLDLFKIYDSENNQNEISRILLKFDLNKLKQEIINNININNPKFRAWLRLFDVKTGNIVPLNYKVCCLPLAKNFDEGYGDDNKFFSNLDISNFLISSYDPQVGEISWELEGANLFGESKEVVDAYENIEYQNNTSVYFKSEQFIENGHEDLRLDITNAISGILSNQIPDCGFLIFFSGSYENDNETRFIKSFASRHSVNRTLHPSIEISYDDSYFDNFNNFALNIENNIYFKNFIRNILVNYKVPDYSNLPNTIEATGENCLKALISYCDFEKEFNVSQVKKGTSNVNVNGTYIAEDIFISSFEIYDQTNNLSFQDLINLGKDINFNLKLIHREDESQVILKNYCLIAKNENQNHDLDPNYTVNITNLSKSYVKDQVEILKVFVNNTKKNLKSTRITTLNRKSEFLNDLHYRVRDAISGKLIFDFDFDYKSTKISYDLESMFFKFDFSVINEFNKPYFFEFGLRDHGGKLIVFKDHINFVVEY